MAYFMRDAHGDVRSVTDSSGTVIISNEVSESTGTTAEEKAAINAEIMPKMLVAGMVTVSVTSVLVAGVMSNWL